MLQKLCSQEAADSLGKETAGAYTQIKYGAVVTSCDSCQSPASSLSWGYSTTLMNNNCQWSQETSTMELCEGSCSAAPALRCWRSCLSRPKLLSHSERHPHILRVPWEWVVVKQVSGGKPTAGGAGYNNLLRSYYLARSYSSVWINGLPGTP